MIGMYINRELGLFITNGGAKQIGWKHFYDQPKKSQAAAEK